MSTPYLFVTTTVLLTVYGQLVIKWQTGKAGALPTDLGARVDYLAHQLLNPWVISGLAAAAVAAVSWIAALSLLPLSRAYPFVAASFVLVLALSVALFGERMTIAKVSGALLIVVGLVISNSRG